MGAVYPQVISRKFLFNLLAIAMDDIAYKKYYSYIKYPFAVQMEVPIKGYSVGFACNNITLKIMQDTFNKRWNIRFL